MPWIQVPSAGQETSGKAGCRAAEVWGGDNGERVLLARAQRMPVCDQTEVECGVLGGEGREEQA